MAQPVSVMPNRGKVQEVVDKFLIRGLFEHRPIILPTTA